MGKSSIEAVEEKLPPGFRFYPRDEELICDYLMNKIVMTFDDDDDATCTNNTNSALLAVPRLVEVDLNKSEPWDIPETACVGGKQWYFYSRRDKKYATGLRTNRATATGYWKATGKDRGVYSNSSRRGGTPLLVGMRKTLVFYRGRAPKGTKSDWVMHEFRLEGSPSPLLPPLKFSSSAKEDWVLCRVFHKDKEDASSGSKQVSGGSSDRIRHDDHYGIQLQTYSTSSSSLPPLVDDPYISFIQTQTSSSNNVMMNHQNHLSNNNPSNNGGNNLQVPCFSIFSQNQTMSYCYSTVVPASVNVPDQQTCTRNSGAYDGVIKQDSISQQNRALFNTNLKVGFNQVTTTSNDPAPSDKLKSKISSSCDDFGDENNSSDRDSYLSESMWRHQQY